jgi:hypothetical protein
MHELTVAVLRASGAGYRLKTGRRSSKSYSLAKKVATDLAFSRWWAGGCSREGGEVIRGMRDKIEVDEDFAALTTEAAAQIEGIKREFADVVEKCDEWVAWRPALIRVQKAFAAVAGKDDEEIMELGNCTKGQDGEPTHWDICHRRGARRNK